MTDVLIQKATTEMNQRTLNVKRWLNDQQNLFIVRHPRWLKIIVMCKQFNSLALSDLALVWKNSPYTHVIIMRKAGHESIRRFENHIAADAVVSVQAWRLRS